MAGSCTLVQAQQVPQAPTDAGNILQQTLPRPALQPRAADTPLKLEGSTLESLSSGGQRVAIRELRFDGISVFPAETLHAAVGDALKTPLDLAGLREIANRISQYYRDNNYPFARAVLPRQNLADGVLKVNVLEGVYGNINTRSETPELAEAVRPFVGALKAGEVINGSALERTMLLIEDLPGITSVPVMRPGETTGTGNLDVGVRATPRTQGRLSLDNHGSRASGEYRLNAQWQANRILTVGDRLSLNALYSDEGLWLGRIGYERPLGYRGARGELAHARTEYNLRSPFDAFTGTADITSLTLRYPLIRQQTTNLGLSVGYQYKALDDRFDDISYQQRYSHNTPLSLQFDHRDALGGGGVTFGNITLTPGHLSNASPETLEGSYTHMSLRISRQQRLPEAFSLLATLEGQWADTPLDSSERQSLGGARSVRAYPQGELSASRAWLTQFELRYRASDALSPYLFYEHGQRIGFAAETSESLSGGGLGLRYTIAGWRLGAAMALQTSGKAANADEQRNPRFWFSTGYRF